MTDLVLRVRVTGRVQGVGFRAFAAAEARRRGLAGWVQNEADGSVAALLAGPATAVEATLAALRRGPPGSEVREVSAADSDENPGRSFTITG